jgi:hypothetical protein
MAMNITALTNLIVSEMNNNKTRTLTNTISVDENGKGTTSQSKDFPDDAGRSLAKSIATAVINYLKENMEIDGTVTQASLPFTSPLSGTGGGPSPVVVPPQSLAVVSGSIKIEKGGIK